MTGTVHALEGVAPLTKQYYLTQQYYSVACGKTVQLGKRPRDYVETAPRCYACKRVLAASPSSRVVSQKDGIPS